MSGSDEAVVSGKPRKPPVDKEQMLAWWSTGITELKPGVVNLRGIPIQDLIGKVGFVPTIWLMLRGELPSDAQARLLEVVLVATVDHGPQSPSSAVSRMGATCGIGLNAALGSAITLLGDHHGGAGQQCMELFEKILEAAPRHESLEEAVRAELAERKAAGEKFVPGFGKHLHPVDPRSARIFEILEQAKSDGTIAGNHLAVTLQIEAELKAQKGFLLPTNIDGAIAAVLGELGFAPPLGRGVFILGRAVGLLAHAWEEIQGGRRNKGPMPPSCIPPYTGNR